MNTNGIDWTLLRLQKNTLVNMLTRTLPITEAESEAVEGVIHLIDYVQDEAAKRLGEETVFGKEVYIAGIVRVTQLVHELSDPDDRQELPAGNAGSGSTAEYDITTAYHPCHAPDWRDPDSGETEAETALLDQFHATVPIGCLEDFCIEVVSCQSDPQGPVFDRREKT